MVSLCLSKNYRWNSPQNYITPCKGASKNPYFNQLIGFFEVFSFKMRIYL